MLNTSTRHILGITNQFENVIIPSFMGLLTKMLILIFWLKAFTLSKKSSLAGIRGMAKTDRGDSGISHMPGCGPNALPKNWIGFCNQGLCAQSLS